MLSASTRAESQTRVGVSAFPRGAYSAIVADAWFRRRKIGACTPRQGHGLAQLTPVTAGCRVPTHDSAGGFATMDLISVGQAFAAGAAATEEKAWPGSAIYSSGSGS